MAAPNVQVRGDKQLAATLHAYAGHLENLGGPNRAVGSLISARGRVGAPRVTGRLASSVTDASDDSEAVAGSGLVYAPRVHWGYSRTGERGNPFLVRSAEASVPAAEEIYARHVSAGLRMVRGA